MDGFDEPYWNLIQTLAWIYLGNRALVRRASDSVTDHGTFMQELIMPDGRKEWVETPAMSPGSIKLVVTAAAYGGAAYQSFEEAEESLGTALQEGKLTALGLENNKGELRPIPRQQWADLKFYWEPPHAAPHQYFRIGAVRWYGLKFERRDVLRLWSDPFDPATETTSVQLRANEGGDFEPVPLEAIFKEAPDYRDWVKADRLPLDDAICFLLEKHPGCARRFRVESDRDDFRRIETLASGSITSGNLMAERSGRRYWVRPTDFLAWARSKDLPIPEPLAEAARRVETRADAPPVLAAQPNPNEIRQDQSLRRGFSKMKLRKWYEQYIKEHGENESPPSREDDWRAACAKFNVALPREAVRALRRELAPADWKKSGRRKTGGKESGGN